MNTALTNLSNYLHKARRYRFNGEICFHFDVYSDKIINTLEREDYEEIEITINLENGTVIEEINNKGAENEQKILSLNKDLFYQKVSVNKNLNIIATESYISNLLDIENQSQETPQKKEILSFVINVSHEVNEYFIVKTKVLKRNSYHSYDVNFNFRKIDRKELIEFINIQDSENGRIGWGRIKEKTVNLMMTSKLVFNKKIAIV